MQFTYYGQSCFLLTLAGKKLLFDPFISGNSLAGDIEVDGIEADYMLLSHGHTDHILDAESIAKRTGATVVCSWEISEWLGKKGIEKIHPMNTGGEWQFEGFRVKCVTAHHSSGLPDGSYGGNPMGFLISSDEGNIYYSGDTALTLDMQLIPRWAKPDVAILPVGNNFTMGVQDAVLAADFVQCDHIIGVHFDTFGYIVIDHEAAVNAFTKAGKNLTLPKIGQTITL